MERRLSAKQKRFIEAYCGNATDAARLAGYKGNDNTLGQVGDENLKKPKIAAAIKAREDERLLKTIANREERQQFWTSIMRDELDDDPQDMKDRLKASELLGKSEGDFLDRIQHGGDSDNPVGISINVNYIDVEEE